MGAALTREIVEKNEAQAVQALRRRHSMETNKGCLGRQPDHVLFHTLELYLTLLSVAAQARPLLTLVEDDVADALQLVSQDTDSIWLVALTKLIGLGVPLGHVTADHGEVERPLV